LKFYVSEMYDAKTETRPRHRSDGILDETNTVKKTPRDRLKTETFETETTTLVFHDIHTSLLMSLQLMLNSVR